MAITIDGSGNINSSITVDGDISISKSSQDVVMELDTGSADKTHWRILVPTSTVSNGTFKIQNFSGASWNDNLIIDSAGKFEVPNGWGGTGSSASVLGGAPLAFHCERSSVDIVGQNLSFGNGDVDNHGARMPFAGKLYCATLQSTNITGTVNYRLLVNNSLQASYNLSVTGSASNEGDTDYFATPYSFSAGDYITWQCTTAPTIANGHVVTFYVVFD